MHLARPLWAAVSCRLVLVTAGSGIARVTPLADAGVATSVDGLETRGYEPSPRRGAVAAALGRGADRGDEAGLGVETLFLDLAMCFAGPVQLVALDVFFADVRPLHEGRFSWRLLAPIPSRSEAATQWFRLGAAWPPAPGGGAGAAAAFPAPGGYRAELSPPLRLGFGDCVGWSLTGAGDGPLAFEDAPAGGNVTWARSTDGLHDAVEMFVKTGADPITARQRQANHIDWTDLVRRTYSVRLLYRTLQERSAPPGAPTASIAATSVAPVVPGGNPSCWRSGFSFEMCCIGGPSGSPNAACWDSFFTFERCCSMETVQQYENLDFRKAASATPHYELRHLSRGNEPRLGPVLDDEALLLYGLVRVMRPKTIVEFGTSNGFSALNWMHAIGDDPEARVYSYDILPYPVARTLEDADPRFVFWQKSQADFEPADVDFRSVDIAFFDAGHLLEYSVKAFERVLQSLSPAALVAVHDTGLHVLDFGSGAPAEEEGRPFSEGSCAARAGGKKRCHAFPGCTGLADQHGFCVGRAHRASERTFVRELLRRWPEFRPLHLHSRRVFRHGLTLLQRGNLWDPEAETDGVF